MPGPGDSHTDQVTAGGAAEPHRPPSSGELRRQAEERLGGLSAAAASAPEDPTAVVHELRVHQVELEMQNEELRRAHLELEAKRAKYFELFDLAPVGYLTLSDTGIVDEANFTVAHLLGVERQQLVGRPFNAFIFAGDQDVFYRHQRSLAKTEAPRTCELRLQRAGAEPFWAHLESRPQGADDGSPPRHLLTVTDVPERALAEEKLRASEERYRGLFEGNHAVMLLIDPRSGAIADANPAACAWYGWSREELFAMRIDQIDTLSRSEIREEMAAAGARRQGVFHVRHRRADGKIRDVEVYSGPLESQGKTLIYSLIHDVTARKQVEAALRRSEEKYRTILQTTMDGFWVVDAGGRLLEVNEAYCRMSGYSMEELLAMTIGDVSGAETAAQIDKISGHGKGRFESSLRRKDGTVFNVEISVQLLPGGGRLTAFVRDITSRKQAESYREMSRQVLQILSAPGDLRESIHRVLAAVKTKTGFDAVGIRLQSGDDYPYFAQQGFSTGFVRTEDTLVERDADGGLCRDADGNVRLECTCGLVIAGGTDPASPIFTAGGSFWINDSFPLLDLPADQDPRLNPRNRCMHDGYASMALVPIRSSGRIVGLIHLNDRRKGRFTLEMVKLMEELAAHIGAALMRKRAEEELRETRDYLESLFSYANAPIIVWDAELRITRFNHAFEELTGRSAGEVIGESLELLFPADERRAKSLELVTRALSGERWRVVEIPILRTDGEVRTVLWNSATLYADDGTTPVATIAQGQDISERKQAEEELASLNQELERETVALAKANATIALIAATDELTGLASRYHFSQALEKAVSLARRHGSPLALVSLDLDGLKQVNDTLGHEVGDEVLASFAALLAALCRAEDLPGRLGGDEFSVLLPGIDLGGACSVAERVLAAVRSCETLAQQGVTVSAGVVARSPDELPVDLLRRADEALYAAKRSGGDAVAGGG